MKQWITKTSPGFSAAEALAEKLGVSSFIVQLLATRGLDKPEDFDAFLSPHLRLLAPLEDWPGVPEAAEHLVQALVEGKKMVVWGDYDVDGITATAMVLDVLEFHGYTAKAHLPDRMAEGYGLNPKTIETLAAEGYELILTVDCGISDTGAVARARELGIQTIISDHHLPPATLPSALAICNPRLADCPCPYLAGVGIAFFLMACVNSLLEPHTGKRMDMREVLDLVALGTLADVVPITGQNRILVKNGLLKIAQAGRPGLAALKIVSGYTPQASLGAGQVVFNLAPRINAAGRLGTPHTALELLRAKDHETAAPLAQTLQSLNTQRRAEEERILAEAQSQAAQQQDKAGIVVYGAEWHQGVIGIVASRLVDTFYRPVLVLCDDKGALKGSGRSVSEFNLHKGLCACAEHLIAFGGHHQAAGLRLESASLEALRTSFDLAVQAQLGEKPLSQRLRIDAELAFEAAADFVLLKELELLQPFGVGNPEPVFVSPPLVIKKVRLFGHKREHVQLEVTDEQSGISLQAKVWNDKTQGKAFSPGLRVRLAYTPGINAYNGIAAVELKVKDWQMA